MSSLIKVIELYNLKLAGRTDVESAEILKVSERTIIRLKKSDKFMSMINTFYDELAMKSISLQDNILKLAGEVYQEVQGKKDFDLKLKTLRVLSKFVNLSLKNEKE